MHATSSRGHLGPKLGFIVLAATAVILTPRIAAACGGTFCSANAPVMQAAERILFSTNPDGTMTAAIQIFYTGPANRFSWVLPVPSVPEVGVLSNVAFDRLDEATEPVYRATPRVEGICADVGQISPLGAADEGWGAGGSAQADRRPPVALLSEGSIGPYDYEVIDVDPAHPRPEEVAIEWLNDNGYDVTLIGQSLLGEYLRNGMKLVAFRLQSDVTTGEIRPVVLTYEDNQCIIPIRLTAVSANADMDIRVWVGSQYRSVPVNYRNLILNEAAIDWINGAPNYDAVVSMAADEAGGHGFVTQYAGASNLIAERIFPPHEEAAWLQTQQANWSGRDGALLRTAIESYGGWDGLPEAIRAGFPGQTVDAVGWAACLECAVADDGPISGFNSEAFLSALESEVIAPMQEAQAIIAAQPYLTRLFTMLSPLEMTVDPRFESNAELPPINNVHTAERVIECAPHLLRSEAPWRVELPNGQVVRGTGRVWPIEAGTDVPANERVEQLDTSGGPVVITDNREAIDEALEVNNLLHSGPISCAGGACSVSANGANSAPWFLLGLLGWLGLRRRRP
jgi:MYXO-CTERM domain-containing protein